ncbi:MAG TPA: TetR/AcrR family transcriptional regulator C-terminal domain-containing protein [Oscillospiraceae bacterium]|nr:TetR/AcrR family transcriptional regulator C-terminal domain-containing protein [Oscillospiraceae bacterium]
MSEGELSAFLSPSGTGEEAAGETSGAHGNGIGEENRVPAARSSVLGRRADLRDFFSRQGRLLDISEKWGRNKMAQFTQKAIIRTFLSMLEETPFDRITVSALVARCGISSNTFYYHFQNIYDLLNAWLEEEKEKYLSDLPNCDRWQDLVKALLYDMKSHKAVVNHVLNSLSRDSIEKYVFESSDQTMYRLVAQVAPDQDLPEEKLRDIVDFCRYAFLGFFLKFIWGHMDFDVEESVDRLSVLFEDFIRQAVENSSKDMEKNSPNQDKIENLS